MNGFAWRGLVEVLPWKSEAENKEREGEPMLRIKATQYGKT
jgi:hypothetical protein